MQVAADLRQQLGIPAPGAPDVEYSQALGTLPLRQPILQAGVRLAAGESLDDFGPLPECPVLVAHDLLRNLLNSGT